MDMGWRAVRTQSVMKLNHRLHDGSSMHTEEWKQPMHEHKPPSFEDMRIQVGARLQLVLERNRQTLYYSSLIGYVAGEYLLVKLPIEHGLSVPMQEGERVIVRAFSGVAVYSFTCSIESVLLAPRYYMHLSFPKEIQATPLREAVRVKVNLPAEIQHTPATHGAPTAAALSDLSISGAFVAAGDELGAPGDRITIAFTFHVQPTNQEVHIRTAATICSCRRLDTSAKTNGHAALVYGAGVHFDSITAMEQVMLQHYLYEAESSLLH
jgi:c-di-GMP-binding flagellar brake protein YcgR